MLVIILTELGAGKRLYGKLAAMMHERMGPDIHIKILKWWKCCDQGVRKARGWFPGADAIIGHSAGGRQAVRLAETSGYHKPIWIIDSHHRICCWRHDGNITVLSPTRFAQRATTMSSALGWYGNHIDRHDKRAYERAFLHDTTTAIPYEAMRNQIHVILLTDNRYVPFRTTRRGHKANSACRYVEQWKRSGLLERHIHVSSMDHFGFVEKPLARRLAGLIRLQ